MPFNPDTASVGARAEALPTQFPAIPVEALAKYPELRAWDTLLQRFWTDVRFVLSRQQEQLQQQVDQKWSPPL